MLVPAPSSVASSLLRGNHHQPAGGNGDDDDGDTPTVHSHRWKPRTGREEALHRDGDGLFLEDELDEGGVEIVSNFPVLLLLHDEFVCRSGVLFGQG